MPRMNLSTTVSRALTRILAERRELQRAVAQHQARLAEIDALFTQAGLTPPAETVGPVARRSAGAEAKARPAAKGRARRKLHRNSKLYKAKVAALQKARAARWAKHRAAKAAAGKA